VRDTAGGVTVKLFSFLRTLTSVCSLVACSLAAQVGLSQAAPVAPTPINKSISAARPRFVCNTGYSEQECREQVRVLRAVLDRYPTQELGDWTWVIVRSQDWKPLKNRLRGNPDSPAFSVLEKRETFLEEALVSPVPLRRLELMTTWSSSMNDLLEIAVTHELGHALCHEEDEAKADRNGRLLREHEPLKCRRSFAE
jgi:hypothetical protein